MGLPGLKRSLALVALVSACSGCAGESDPDEVLGELSLRLRPDVADGGLPQPLYEPGSTVLFYDSSAGNFRVHFVRAGAHEVPAQDADASGVPDYVEETAAEYERVLAFYRGQGFLAPLSDEAVSDGNGGDGRFDVYLMNFPTGADGSYRGELCREAPARGCAGYMLQENDFDGRNYASLRDATRILASHELFHAVQNAYVNEASSVLSEASAVWASERYEPRSNDFESFVPGYLARPERSLLQEPTGPPDAFSYGAALWFVQLTQAYDQALVRRLWEEIAQSDSARAGWGLSLARVLSRDYQSSLLDAFTRFARWNLLTAGRADPGQSYAEGARYPLVTERGVTLPYHEDLLRLLPLSARYFAASAAGEHVQVAVAPRDQLGEHRLLLARERAGRIVEVRESAAAQGGSLEALATDDRVHVVLVDARAQGETLRVQLCIGDEAALASCATVAAEAGVLPDDRDAGVMPTEAGDAEIVTSAHAEDASVARVDAALATSVDAAQSDAPSEETGPAVEDAEPAPDAEPDAAVSEPHTEHDQAAMEVRRRGAGCSLNPRTSDHGLWLTPALAGLWRRRRAASQRRSFS